MIQRIQSIYLLISLIAWGLLFFTPIVGFTDEVSGAWMLYADGIKESMSGKLVLGTVPMLILFILVEVLVLMALLIYRNRMIQLRTTVLAMIMQILSFGIIASYVIQGKAMLNAIPGLLFWSAMPLVAAVFSYLAFRGIRRDMLLLRAQDRLR
jgi:hypothetical protein